MHIDRLRLQRFRSCADVTVCFHHELTVLVGENNSGKSNIIDGLRLLTLPLNGRRERYPEDDDLRRGGTQAQYSIEGRFAGLSDTIKGLLISAVPDPTADLAVFGTRYQPRTPGTPRGRLSYWAGRFDTTEPESGSTDLIRHVYLPPLRDAKHALGFVRVTAGRPHVAQHAHPQATFKPRGRATPPMRQSVSACKLGG